MSVDISYGVESRKKLKEGIDILSNAVGSTLGPVGNTVLIESSIMGKPRVTKDGVSVAKEINLDDRVQAQGADLLKDVAINTNNQVGDGTTTSIVLAQQLINKGMELLENKKINGVVLKNSMEKAYQEIKKFLESRTLLVENNPTLIKKIATISTNNDHDLGELVAEAYSKIGKGGVVKIQPTQIPESSVEVIDGLEINSGVLSRYFLPPSQLAEQIDKPKILVTDYNINSLLDMKAKDGTHLLETISKENEHLVILCNSASDQVIQTLVKNKLERVLYVTLIKSPRFGQERADLLQDICTLTGATLVSAEQGFQLSDVTMAHLGSCSVLNVSQEKTTFVGGRGDKDLIKERLNILEERLETASISDKVFLRERISKLGGGISLIKLGAKSESESKEKFDRVEDAIRSVEAAMEGGVIPGGGASLMKFIPTYKRDLQEDIGYTIVMSALKTPITKMLENAGFEENGIETVILKINSNSVGNFNYGYNILTEEYGDMLELGVIDPLNVTLSALENAISVASIILSTNCVVTYQDEAKQLTI